MAGNFEKSNCIPRVAIIGGGLAGLSAAGTLAKSGKFNVLLFEGSGRIGGRVFPFQYGDGYLQHGAEYINGIENEVYQLAESKGLLQDDDRIGDAFIGSDDTLVVLNGKTINGRLIQEFRQFLDRVDESLQDTCDVTPAVTIGTTFDRMYRQWVEGRGNRTEFDHLAQIHRNNYATEWSGSADELALTNFCKWSDGSDVEDSAFLNKIGFKGILDHYLSRIPKEIIRMNWKIVNIAYGDGPVNLTFSDGKVEEFDHVIVTSSLGYLKKYKGKMFTPLLPYRKDQAIAAFGFGSNMKIFLEYDQPWWPTDLTSFLVKNSTEKNLIVFQTSNWNSKILIAWLAEDGPIETSRMDDEQLKSHLDCHLKNGLPFYDVPKVRRIFRHTWINDEFSLGSYSYWTPSSVRLGFDVVEELGSPIMVNGVEKVLFAGEHTDLEMYQTTVGAVQSGKREAERLINMY